MYSLPFFSILPFNPYPLTTLIINLWSADKALTRSIINICQDRKASAEASPGQCHHQLHGEAAQSILNAACGMWRRFEGLLHSTAKSAYTQLSPFTQREKVFKRKCVQINEHLNKGA